jgi:hypothetical protein
MGAIFGGHELVFSINLRYNTYHQIILYNGRLWLFQWRFGYQVLCLADSLNLQGAL